jgi:4-hydroxythreonine-4-phosphate dehydrogenase
LSINSSSSDLRSISAKGSAFRSLPLAISIGDPAGIGPEILIKSLLAHPELVAKCCIYGPRELLLEQLDRHAKQAEASPSNFQPTQARGTQSNGTQALQDLRLEFTKQLVQDVALPTNTFPAQIRAGTVDALSGEIAFRSIVAATQAVLQGRARALITAPIHKEAMHLAGHIYPGHTELLAELAGGVPVRMMLANPELRTVLVTIHMSLRQALDAITESAIVETLKITDASLRRFGIGQQRAEHAPCLAVAGLNPHAGEGGLFGREEIEIIRPAIAKARSLGINAEGPFAPDTVFMRARGLKQYDAVIALYHDQGLIPVKYLGVEQGVNVTLGLPFVRTSPDHGTAFDIAGQGCADASSMLSALHMADQLSRQ